MTEPRDALGLTGPQATMKRLFDILCSSGGLLLGGWLIVVAWLVASVATRSNGFFVQARVGRHAKPFRIVKIKTMVDTTHGTSVTRTGDARLTRSGALMRRLKIDELPQLFNVLVGQMSLVGPRPDVPGFADELRGDDRLILSVRPGITGPASLKYRDEESLLARHDDFERFNREVIWPDKVRINLDYVRNWSFARDIAYLWRTVFG